MDHRSSIAEFCERIGKNPLLVQGAGGNVSWKEDRALWIKASGTWLANAKKDDIFVPVDLTLMKRAIEEDRFSVAPTLLQEGLGKPSIETILHSIMPHRVVVHLHAVDIMPYLVTEDGLDDLRYRLRDFRSWVFVDYWKPGALLAQAVVAAMRSRGEPVDVALLANHGIIIGGATIEHVEAQLEQLVALCRKSSADFLTDANSSITVPQSYREYAPIADDELHRLATDPALFHHVQQHWALYPDHVVFLGPKPFAHNSWENLKNSDEAKASLAPKLIFIRNEGVFTAPSFNTAMLAQLRCFYDVLIRSKPDAKFRSLTASEVDELLNWDSEKYRTTLASHAEKSLPQMNTK